MSYQFAIIGCGHIGKRHAEHISRLGNLVAVCDTIPAKADELAAQYNCRAYYDIDALIAGTENMDVLSVCTPNYLHEPHTITGLKAGHHIICEKPMAISSESCRKMIAAADLSGKKIFVVKQNRYNPPVQAVKRLINNNALGKILQINVNCFWNRDAGYYQSSDWKGIRTKDGGILFTQFSHFADVLFYLAGPMKVLSGVSNNFMHDGITDFEDSAAFILQTAQSGIISFNASTCAYGKNMEGSLSILAEKGSIKIGGQYMNTIDHSNIKDVQLPEINIQQQNNQYGHYEGSMSNHHLVIQNVIDTLDGRSEAMTNAAEGLQVVELIEAMYVSCKL
ncbi:MAG: Gfo/Idh/MocA family oxidoreductase [Ferruginibacter sp.]